MTAEAMTAVHRFAIRATHHPDIPASAHAALETIKEKLLDEIEGKRLYALSISKGRQL